MEPEVVRVERRGRKRKRRDGENAVDGGMRETRSKALVGSYLNKEFEGDIYLGKVVNYQRGLYRVEYEDGDSEDLDSKELRPCLIVNEDSDEGLVVRKKALDDMILRKYEDMEREKKEREARNMMIVDAVGNGNNGVLASRDCSTDSGEDTIDGDLGIEVEASVVPPPELPPSTGNIGVPDECVADLLSVYSYLRSFSCALFLSPFGLDDFVGSLNCSFQNTLLDAIHVALMRVIHRHFEALSSDGSELASKCLRSMDWSLIDTLTWPVFTVQYMMMMGYTEGLEWKSFYIDALQRDYYSLSVRKKLMILQILCDDALDSSELRAEIDMVEEAEFKDEVDHDRVVNDTPQIGPIRVHPRYSKTSAFKGLEATAVIEGSIATKASINTSSLGYMNTRLNTGVADVDQDANSDECRLCGMEGTLLCCDGCPSAYHSRCIGVMKMFIPEGDWYCPECTINKTSPTITRETSLKGAVFFGVDPYEQVFMGTCDHLLVIRGSRNTEPCVRYYHKEDISVVLKVLGSAAQHHDMYSGLCEKIMRYWDIAVVEGGTSSARIDDGAFSTEELSLFDNNGYVVSKLPVSRNTESCVAVSSSENRAGLLLEKTTKNVAEACFYTGASFKPQSYLNHYAHGDFAAAAATNLSILSSVENHVAVSNTTTNHRKLMSANISLQTKAFSSATIRFFWPDIEKKLMEVPRERCGWCLSCQATCHSKRGCLLNAAASNAIKGTMKILAAIRPVKHGEGSLHSIATYLLFMEESLRGLMVGPFKTSAHRLKWCKQAEQASTCSDLKSLLLELEENIPHVALFGDWIKIADGSPVEPSANHSTTAAGSSQKRGPGRRGRKPSAMPEFVADDDKDISDAFVWWCGGMLSKAVFQKGILPHIVVKNSARQGGSKKISGIYYADGAEVPKRSRRAIWRAAVEMSRNPSQLAAQIRYLDIHVRWGDLVRPELSSLDGKGGDTDANVFRNASICDKQVLESKISYAVAFGNQKHLPSRIMKKVSAVEKIEGGEEKYWFLETRVPLYMIKEYEEKMVKLSPSPPRKPTNVLSTLQRQQLKVSRKNIFSYLVRRRDNLDCCRCAACQLDVLLRTAVKCSTCEGYCHFQCTAALPVDGKGEAEFAITCRSCDKTEATLHGEKYNVAPANPMISQGQKPLSTPTAVTCEKQNGCNQPLVLNGGVRRSVERKPRPALASELQEYEQEVKSASKSKPKNKSKACSLGLIWSKKDEDGTAFRSKNVLLKGNSYVSDVECDLCRNPYNPDHMYIFCETCTKWYHADAVELEESKLFKLIGFKCCKCRRIKSPLCPYTSAERRIELEGKKPNKRTRKQARQGTSLLPETSSEQLARGETASHVLPITKELVSIKGDNPLTFSLSRAEHDTHSTSGVALEQKPTLAGSAPQKLPVRRHMKREDESCEAVNNVSVDSFTPIGGNTFLPKDESPPCLEWDLPKNIENDYVFSTEGLNYEEIEYEPQTYFSFNELLANDDGAQLEGVDPSGNLIETIDQLDGVDPSGNIIENIDDDMLPAEGSLERYGMMVDQQETINSFESSYQVVPCHICSYTDPIPDCCCHTCGVWMHRYCTGWVEDIGAWRCCNCHGWQ